MPCELAHFRLDVLVSGRLLCPALCIEHGRIPAGAHQWSTPLAVSEGGMRLFAREVLPVLKLVQPTAPKIVAG